MTLEHLGDSCRIGTPEPAFGRDAELAQDTKGSSDASPITGQIFVLKEAEIQPRPFRSPPAFQWFEEVLRRGFRYGDMNVVNRSLHMVGNAIHQLSQYRGIRKTK